MKTIVLASLIVILIITGIAYSAAYKSITVADTAIGLGTSGMDNTRPSKVVCTLETGQIRIRMDGAAATATEGHVLDLGQQVTISDSASITNFSAIRTGTTSGVLKCSYF